MNQLEGQSRKWLYIFLFSEGPSRSPDSPRPPRYSDGIICCWEPPVPPFPLPRVHFQQFCLPAHPSAMELEAPLPCTEAAGRALLRMCGRWTDRYFFKYDTVLTCWQVLLCSYFCDLQIHMFYTLVFMDHPCNSWLSHLLVKFARICA